MSLFEKLAFEEYVDATFQSKSDRNHWPLCLVELNFSTSKIVRATTYLLARKTNFSVFRFSLKSIRDRLKEFNCTREVKNEEIYAEFHHLLKPTDYIIYSISNENDHYDDH